MVLTYSKLRKVLSILLQNKALRESLVELLSGREKELDELGFLDLLEDSKADLEILEILTEHKVEDIPAEEALGVFADFFCSIKNSWERFKPVLSSLGLRVEADVVTT